MFIDWFLIRVKSSFYYPNLPIIIFTNKKPRYLAGLDA